ncbi:AAA family ATPase [Nonomuraea sp. NPDC049309]|uniref:AAA family ATPase n=1 Tax=Nonomuraea sp. NPDC049309 TaxID=3364350 RepID=UPI00371860A3
MKTARAALARARRGFLHAARGGVETYLPGDVTTRFHDVWGQDHVVERVREDIALFQRPEEIERRGGRAPGGLLLWGPPGTGKSLIAEAVAGETGRPYVRVDSAALTGVLQVRALFRRVRRLAARHGGVVVFFDGADALGGSGVLRSLITELTRLNRPARPLPGLRPAVRAFVIMTAGRPGALDEALLRHGRIDRVYEVGRPSRAGRERMIQGHLGKVAHQLTAEQIGRLAAVTPHATGADIEDLVNESLIAAIRAGREVITWPDVLRARRLKRFGPVGEIEPAERHALAVHEACHAVVAYVTRPHRDLDMVTVESGACHLGPAGAEDARWRSECEADIMVALAAVAGERMLFGGDSSARLSADLHAAAYLMASMESRWGMGAGLASLPALQELEIGPAPDALGERVEAGLARLLERTEELLREHRREVLCLAHALEAHGTLDGDDAVAVIRAERGPLIDGTGYASDAFYQALEAYHRDAVKAHWEHRPIGGDLPAPPAPAPRPGAPRERPQFVPWAAASPPPQPSARPHEQPAAPAPPAWRRTAGRVWTVVASALVLVLVSLLTALAVTNTLSGAGGTAEAGGATGITIVGAGGDAAAEPGVPSAGLLFVLFVAIVAVIVGAGLAYAAVRRMRTAQLTAERERDRAHARAQFLAATLDPATAMRLLGYDGTGRT